MENTNGSDDATFTAVPVESQTNAYPTTRIPAPRASQKPSHGDISGTKSGKDTLVSKQPEKF